MMMGIFAQSWPVSLGISPAFSFVVVLGILFISFEMNFVSNVFNTVLSEQFLQDMVEYSPASARFVEHCYGEPTRLVYRGELAWCERDQQDCPMMGPLFYSSRCRMLREAQQASSRPMPEFRPAFADDGFSGGPVLDVWKQFRQEIRLAEVYDLKVDPNKWILYLLGGETFRGDVSRFQALGVKVIIGGHHPHIKDADQPGYGFSSFIPEKQTH